MKNDHRLRPHVAVLMGGRSSEREISLVTGEQVARALEETSFPVTRVDAGEEPWVHLSRVRPDVVFIALHGRWGEDGTVQAMLELMDIPYTGSGVLASSLAMDKAMSKSVFRDKGLPVAKSVDLHVSRWLSTREQVMAEVVEHVGFPCVAKPAREGSAVGVTIVRQLEQLADAIDAGFIHDSLVLVEEFLPGLELTVGVLEGPDGPSALPSVEIVPNADFYDYEAKYAPGGSEHIIPARLPDEVQQMVSDWAIKAHDVIGCRDLSRTDFKLDKEGNPVILEINTIPGMTPTSLFPEAAAAAGISFPRLIEMITEFTLARRDAR